MFSHNVFQKFCLDSLLDDKMLALHKLKAFADDCLIMTRKVQFLCKMAENIVGKGESAG